MKERLYEIFKIEGKLSKVILKTYDDVPPYNTLMRKHDVRLNELNREFDERLYNENPKLCLTCNEKINYSSDIEVRKFCSHECAATYNNKLRIKKEKTIKIKIEKIIKTCNYCKHILSSSKKTFCSNNCSTMYKFESNVTRWLLGNDCGYKGKTKQLKSFIRKYLHQTRGTACEICGWDEKHPIDGLVLTEVDHIDGDASNNRPENLRILCPNHHAMTKTFRNRNKNSSRDRT